MRRALVFALAVLALSACSEPLEFADWTILEPEGARIIEYAWVPLEERTEAVETERDLVLAEAFGLPLYQPRKVQADENGRIFVRSRLAALSSPHEIGSLYRSRKLPRPASMPRLMK